MIEIRFSEKDRVIIILSILFGLLFGIIGNFFSTLFFRYLDITQRNTPEMMFYLYITFLLVVTGMLFFLATTLSRYKLIMPGKFPKKKGVVKKSKKK